MISTDNLWSNSLSKNKLTVYTEGLACNNFDQRRISNTRRYIYDVCFFLKKEVYLLYHVLHWIQKTKYDRVRVVAIDSEGSMPGACGYVQHYLISCPHIWSAIGKQECYAPSMFHMRWHQLYNYYHSSNFFQYIASNVYKPLTDMFKVTRTKYY